MSDYFYFVKYAETYDEINSYSDEIKLSRNEERWIKIELLRLAIEKNPQQLF